MLDVFLRASTTLGFILYIGACVAVAEPAGRALDVHVSRAPKTLQKGIWSLRLLSQTLLSPFSQSHHHTNNPEDNNHHFRV